MFTAKLEVDDFRASVRKTHLQVNLAMHDGVSAGSKAGRDQARRNGRFKNRTGWLRRSIRMLKIRRQRNGIWGGYEAQADYSKFVEEKTKAHWIKPIDYWGATRKKGQKIGARHTIGRRAEKLVKSPTHGAGRGKFLRFRIGGKVVFARKVWHPGTAADPFMEPAKEQAFMAAVRKINSRLNKLNSIWR